MSMHIRAIIVAVVAAGPAAAFADISYYAGLGVGGSSLREDLNVTLTAYDYQGNPLVLTPIVNPFNGQPATTTLDKFKGTDLGYRVFGGMRFGRFLGLEVGYVDLGKPEDTLGLTIPASLALPPTAPLRPKTNVALKLTDEIDGIDAYVVGALPLTDHWEVFAKLGFIFWDSTLTIRNEFSDTYPPSPPSQGEEAIPTVTPPSSSEDTDGTDLAGGLGVNYKAAEHLTIRGAGTWYDIEDTEQAWLLGVDLIYDF